MPSSSIKPSLAQNALSLIREERIHLQRENARLRAALQMHANEAFAFQAFIDESLWRRLLARLLGHRKTFRLIGRDLRKAAQ